jgi:hypothetical protein
MSYKEDDIGNVIYNPSYNRPVEKTSSSKSFGSTSESFGATQNSLKKMGQQRTLHADMNPSGRIITVRKKSPVIDVTDVTGSFSDALVNFFRVSPMAFLEIVKYLGIENFEQMVMLFGDATSDRIPLQVSEPVCGIELDDWLIKCCLREKGGGNTLEESSELAAWFIWKKVILPEILEMPFCFFSTDEKPYNSVNPDHVREILGIRQGIVDLDTKQIFSGLYEKFNGNLFLFLTTYGCDSYYDSYSERIYKSWQSYIPKSNIIQVPPGHQKALTDLKLGVIALLSGARNVEEYLVDMKKRRQTDERMELVREVLLPVEERFYKKERIQVQNSNKQKSKKILTDKNSFEIF